MNDNKERFDLKKIEKYSYDELMDFLKQEKDREDTAYQIFCHCAASRASFYVNAFCEASKNQKEIKNELNRRKYEGNHSS